LVVEVEDVGLERGVAVGHGGEGALEVFAGLCRDFLFEVISATTLPCERRCIMREATMAISFKGAHFPIKRGADGNRWPLMEGGLQQSNDHV
jgi:hypothetical protein